jgi:hypothetical protein
MVEIVAQTGHQKGQPFQFSVNTALMGITEKLLATCPLHIIPYTLLAVQILTLLRKQIQGGVEKIPLLYF